MKALLTFVAMAVVLAGGIQLWVVTAALWEARRRLRGPRLAQCPQTKGLVELELDAFHGALSWLCSGSSVRIAKCSRWPHDQGCAQDCIRTVDPQTAIEHGLLVRPLGRRNSVRQGEWDNSHDEN